MNNPCLYENFDITIQGSRRPYTATFIYRGQGAEGEFDQDITLPAWQAFDENADAGRPGQAFGPAGVAQRGSDLFQALFHTHLRDLWTTAQADLDRGQVGGLRVRLNLRPPAVAALPWEILRDPDRRRTFAANRRTPLVRMETLQRYVGPSRPLVASLPLKLLLALPTDPTGQIDGAVEEAAIRTSLGDLVDRRISLSTLTGKFDVLKLGEVLEQVRPDILHLVTHGLPGGIQLWQEGEPHLVTAESLGTALGWSNSVKLAVLNACQTARDPVRAPLASLGAHMLQTGIPGVIAMQFPILDSAAVRFSQLLYRSLMDGACAGQVDAAVAHARSGLYALHNQEISFGTPVLWLNSPDGMIFELPAPAAQAAIPQIVTAPSGPDLDLAEVRAWLDSLVPYAPSQFTNELKLLAHQRQQALTRLDGTIRQMGGLYARRAQGDLVAADIRRQEKRILDQRATVHRLEQAMQEALHSLPPTPSPCPPAPPADL